MTTPYETSISGQFAAIVPARGPCWRDENPCAVALDHKRHRKTGPPWKWVAVMRCTAHGLAFTAYPPGQVPYGREPLVVLAPDGSEVAATEPGGHMTAAADAGRGERWPREMAEEAVRTTQRRRIREAASLLGLVVGEQVKPALASAVLHLAEGQLVETRRLLAASHDLVAWGVEVIGLVEVVARRGGRWLMDRFAVLGHLAGWWGRPWRWEPRGARLRALGESFWPGTRGRGPPPEPS